MVLPQVSLQSYYRRCRRSFSHRRLYLQLSILIRFTICKCIICDRRLFELFDKADAYGALYHIDSFSHLFYSVRTRRTLRTLRGNGLLHNSTKHDITTSFIIRFYYRLQYTHNVLLIFIRKHDYHFIIHPPLCKHLLNPHL
jgi:hypothetical protein